MKSDENEGPTIRTTGPKTTRSASAALDEICFDLKQPSAYDLTYEMEVAKNDNAISNRSKKIPL